MLFRSRFLLIDFVQAADINNGDLWVYDAATDKMVAHAPMPAYGYPRAARSAIFNSDATQILVDNHIILDQNLNPIRDLWPGMDYRDCLSATFSPDGSKVYCFGDPSFPLPSVVRVFDVASGANLGDISSCGPADFISGIAVSSRGLAVILSSRGYAVLDVTAPKQTFGPVQPGFTISQKVTAADAPQPVEFEMNVNAPLGGIRYFFGDSPAAVLGPPKNPPSPYVVRVQPPPGKPGAVEVTVTSPDGRAAYAPEGFSYGPVILFQSVDTGGSEGGTAIHLIGYGFDDPSGKPRITIGGASAQVTGQFLAPGISPYPFPIEHLDLLSPPGRIGPADITVSTANGSFTKSKGFWYASHAQVRGLQPLQMVVDEGRQQVYVADGASGDVEAVDTTTLAASTLISMGATPATGLAMTPDHRRLLVISAKPAMLTVFDLNAKAVLRSFVPVPGNQATTLVPNAIAATANGTALVGLGDPASSAKLYEVDLESGKAIDANSLFVLGICDWQWLLAPSSDGSNVYIAPLPLTGESGGVPLSLWSAALDGPTFQKGYSDESLHALSATASGDRVVTDLFSYSSRLDLLTAINANDLLVSLRYRVPGQTSNLTGSLHYMPTTKGIEIYDVNHGEMRRSVGIDGGVVPTVAGLAMDGSGSTLYVAEAMGLGLVRLGNAPLSIGSVIQSAPHPGKGRRVTLLGTGFQSGTRVTVGDIPVESEFGSSTAITFLPPLIYSSPRPFGPATLPEVAPHLSITVVNPDGETYTLGAAFDPRTLEVLPSPAIAGVSSPIRDGSRMVIEVTGSGFLPVSQITMDGVPVQTVYVDDRRLSVYLYRPTAGAHKITVVNPHGGSSNSQPIKISPPP